MLKGKNDMDIYVDVRAGRDGNGSKEMPFRRINEAAKVAKPGDTVLVAPGVYREYVDPIFAGEPDARITYKSTEPLAPVGSIIRTMYGCAECQTVPLVHIIRILHLYMAIGILPRQTSILDVFI